MHIVVLHFTHYVIVYTLTFFYTNLAVLAVVILCCVRSGVAGKHLKK